MRVARAIGGVTAAAMIGLVIWGVQAAPTARVIRPTRTIDMSDDLSRPLIV